jgi:hypothetical protein
MVQFSALKLYRVTTDEIEHIESAASSPLAQAEAALKRICEWGVTASQLAQALYASGLQLTSKEFEQAAYSPGAAFIPTPISRPVYEVASLEVTSPQPMAVASTRKRLVDATKKLEDAKAYVVAKIPFVRPDDDDDSVKLSTIAMNVVKFTASKEAAERIANEAMDDDVEDVGGDESKVKHSYGVFRYDFAVAPSARAVKNRVREKKSA